ncbi:MAG: peroxiredoxin [Bacteroidota bacterium]
MRSIPAALLMSTAMLFQQAEAAGGQLTVGDPAPHFTLPGATKDSLLSSPVSLSDYAGKAVVILAFYPADWSGGCTKEMCTMRDNFKDLGQLGATVLGISGDYVHSHREWAKALDLPFALLSDHDHAVARRYDSYNPDRGYNLRTIYVVDETGAIAYVDLAYKPGSSESFDMLRNALKTIRGVRHP